MSPISLLLIAGGIMIAIIALGGTIAYLVFAVPAMKAAPPMTNEDRAICEQIVRARNGYPWLCRQSVRKGTCPCRPCPKLEGAKKAR